MWVDEGFQIGEFADAFLSAFAHLERAERGLQACGFTLPQPEGWGYFSGRSARVPDRRPTALSGDAHTAREVRRLKQTEDDTFLFQFTFIETNRGDGFVTHYQPKHPPFSAEMTSLFDFLGLRKFDECPEFDFESCYYKTLSYQSHGDTPFDSNTDHAHRCFDAHVGQFSAAIQGLLTANAEIEKVGLTFLPFPKPAERIRADLTANLLRPAPTARSAFGGAPPPKTSGLPERFDVAISFAGTERDQAHQLAELARAAGFVVFYDDFYPEQLWGKDLVTFFDEIFRKRSRFCVIFISGEYRDRKWTSHEMRSAQARALEEKGKEYILPIRVDDAELDGMLPTVGYVSIDAGVDKIGELLIRKLRSSS
jgi:hypothetical protein